MWLGKLRHEYRNLNKITSLGEGEPGFKPKWAVPDLCSNQQATQPPADNDEQDDEEEGDDASLCQGLCLLLVVYSASAPPVARGFTPVAQLCTMRIREAA